MKKEKIFSLGEKVIVSRNSERYMENSKIGLQGIVSGYKSLDCEVRDNSGKIHYIYQNDLDIV